MSQNLRFVTSTKPLISFSILSEYSGFYKYKPEAPYRLNPTEVTSDLYFKAIFKYAMRSCK